MVVLRHWLDFLFPPRSDEVVLRGVSVDDFLALVAPRLLLTTQPETVALFPFNIILVRAAAHEAKYHGNAFAFRLLSSALAEYLRDADDGFRKPIIVPIPLGKGRYKERGFNQVEKIIELAAEGLDVTVDRTLLERTRETASQVSLPRHAREENMRGAFGATRPADPAHTYIVVDDVTTTGATLQAAIDALRESGAKHVIPLALAH